MTLQKCYSLETTKEQFYKYTVARKFMPLIEDVNPAFKIPIENAFSKKYENHGLQVPLFLSSKLSILEEQYSNALLEKFVLSDDYLSLVPDFLRSRVRRPMKSPFSLADDYSDLRGKIYPKFQQMDMPRFFDAQNLFYKSMGSALAYLRHTANSSEYTHPKNFQTVFEHALNEGVFAGRDDQPLVAVHCGAGIQEGVWFEMIKAAHGYSQKPVYTDSSVNMLRICNAFNPSSRIYTQKKFTQPIICIANNCLPSIPTTEFSNFIESLSLPRGSLLFATAATELTDTQPEAYYHGDKLYGALFEDLLFLSRGDLPSYIDFFMESTGSESRLSTQADLDKHRKYGYIESFTPGIDHIDLMSEIHMYAKIKRHIPVPKLGRIPQINPLRKIHLASSYRLEQIAIDILKSAGTQVFRDKTGSAVGLAIKA